MENGAHTAIKSVLFRVRGGLGSGAVPSRFLLLRLALLLHLLHVAVAPDLRASSDARVQR